MLWGYNELYIHYIVCVWLLSALWWWYFAEGGALYELINKKIQETRN